MITSRAVIMSMHRAIFLSLMVLEIYVYETWSFPFIFFHSCRNLEVTALRRGTGRELLLRCW